MKIKDSDIKKTLAELPEIDLPEGFHNETMQRIRAEAANISRKKKSRIIWYIGSFSTAAAATIAILLVFTNFGNTYTTGEIAEFDAPTAWIAPHGIEERIADPEIAIAHTPTNGSITRSNDPFSDSSQQAITTITYLRPAHLPTDLIDFDLGDRYALTFQIIIAVDDIAYAQESIRTLGISFYESVFNISIQPSFEDLEAIFTQLYALGNVEEYSITIADTWVLSNMQQINDLITNANTITVILLQN
ncbi:MAG: hypothetical protein FWE34_04380 [Defluviitaleaceae bacterium]|nr:hypothetical protein [Defluviitaleaceae bacterium]